jgi:transcriptional regulator with XRE-family HTH domain
MIYEHLPAHGELSLAGDIGARLRLLREQPGLSQRALGEPKLSGSYVSLIERGKLRPTLPMLHHFATRLGVSLLDVLDPEDGAPHKRNGDTGRRARSAVACPFQLGAADRRQEMILLQVAALLRLHSWPLAEHLLSTMARAPLPFAYEGWYVLYSAEALWEQERVYEARTALVHLASASIEQERLFYGHLHLLRGQIERVLGHFSQAREEHRRGLEMVEKDEQPALLVILLANLAYDSLLLDASALAHIYAYLALDALSSLMKAKDGIKCVTLEAQDALHKSLLAGEKGELEEASLAALHSLELATVSRAAHLQSWIRCALAYALQRQGKLAAAEAEFRRAIAEASDPQSAFDCGALVVLHCCLAALLLATGKQAQAVQEARTAQALGCMQPDHRQMQALVALTWAVICAGRGEEARADEHFLRALHLLHEHLPTGGKAGVFSRFCELLNARKQIGTQMSELIGWWAIRAAARL